MTHATPTNRQIAADYDLWSEWFDTNAEMTENEFDAIPEEDRLEMINNVFAE